ncbi:MAG: follicular epithelium yolk protein subunit [Methanosarcina sp.]
MGKSPRFAYLHNPTPGWKDSMYDEFKWNEVQTTVRIVDAIIISNNLKTNIIASKTFANNSSRRATFNGSITEEVQETVETNWSSSIEVEVSQTISCEVDILGAGSVGKDVSMSCGMTFSVGGSFSKSETLGTESGASFELDPGESAVLELVASKGVLKAKIKYIAELSGQVAINYKDRYNGHFCYGPYIKDVMEKHDPKHYAEYTQEIEVQYYTDTKVELRDEKGELKKTYSVIGLEGMIDKPMVK